ncbi:MAG: amidohydrolase [Candidatus Lokiarchaeota archaeon]|nr:amidohydrolase [Candidatus Lokiarchaeota archaeon]
MIIDSHCHIFNNTISPDLIKYQFNQFEGYGFYKRILEKMNDINTIDTDNIKEKTIFHIKHAKIDKVVLLPLSIKENDKVMEWVKHSPDVFIPFYNPPERATESESIQDVVERVVVTNKIKGFKIMLPFRKKKLNDKVIFPVLEIAEKHDLPLLFHTGYPPPGTKKQVLTYSNPVHLEELIGNFSKLKIIIAHMGYPWVDIAISLAVQYPNIYMDISNLTYMMPNRLKELILRAKEVIGTNKILFGSDGFTPEMIEIAKSYFNDIDYLNDTDINNILGNNAKKLLKL